MIQKYHMRILDDANSCFDCCSWHRYSTFDRAYLRAKRRYQYTFISRWSFAHSIWISIWIEFNYTYVDVYLIFVDVLNYLCSSIEVPRMVVLQKDIIQCGKWVTVTQMLACPRLVSPPSTTRTRNVATVAKTSSRNSGIIWTLAGNNVGMPHRLKTIRIYFEFSATLYRCR